MNILTLIALLFLAASLLARPTLLGVDAAPFSLALSGVALLLLWLFTRFRLSKRNLQISLMVAVFWVFLTIHSILNGNTNGFPVTQAFLIIGTTLIYACALSHPVIHYWYFRLFVIFILIQCGSYVITMFLNTALSLGSLFVYKIELHSAYQRAGHILFPFTNIYGTYRILGNEFPRFSALFREPGIAQAYITWAFLSLPILHLKKRWIQIVLLAGLLGTTSSLAIPVFLATFTLVKIAPHRRIMFRRLRTHFKSLILMTFVALIVGVITFYLPDIGLQAKLNRLSGSSRLDVVMAGLETFRENPFGIGIYNSTVEMGSVNIIAWLGQIGILGGLLLLLVYLTIVVIDRFNYRKIALLSVFFLTWFISQPFHDAALLYIFFLQMPEPPPRKYPFWLSRRHSRMSLGYRAQPEPEHL